MANSTTQPKAIRPSSFEAELVELLRGIQDILSPTVTFLMDGNPIAQAALDSMLQGWIQKFRDVEAAKQVYQNALKERTGIVVEARERYKTIRALLKACYGPANPILLKFGIAPEKPRSTSTKTKAAAMAKASQTRAVRGTRSKKQKQAITVVGNPPVAFESDGTMRVGERPVLDAAKPPKPTGPGSGSGTPGNGSTPGGK